MSEPGRLACYDSEGSDRDLPPASRRSSRAALAGVLTATLCVAVGVSYLARPQGTTRVVRSLIDSGKDTSEELTAACSSTPFVGPDSVPSYNHESCMAKHLTNNNCYNYALDIVARDWLYPGACSVGAPRCTFLFSCDIVTLCAKADGLIYLGKSLPPGKPARGHYVALLNGGRTTSYHWLRQDEDGYWSYKDGPGNVSRVDNRGDLISDPPSLVAAGLMEPYYEFCGYFTAVPSKVVKNVCCENNRCCGEECPSTEVV
uniref:Uncharacterized protein n=1 Tax=Alexandrium monilatum TaxID=311494 RepID=A0A7S4VXH1_9DINO